MLMCGEDLGFVPACVPPVMHELGVVALRIQRMSGAESPEGSEFGVPACYSYLTVASPACHDTSTTRAWFEEDAGRRERFFYRCLDGAACCAAGGWCCDLGGSAETGCVQAKGRCRTRARRTLCTPWQCST